MGNPNHKILLVCLWTMKVDVQRFQLSLRIEPMLLSMSSLMCTPETK
jgi:hypothetical protein